MHDESLEQPIPELDIPLVENAVTEDTPEVPADEEQTRENKQRQKENKIALVNETELSARVLMDTAEGSLFTTRRALEEMLEHRSDSRSLTAEIEDMLAATSTLQGMMSELREQAPLEPGVEMAGLHARIQQLEMMVSQVQSLECHAESVIAIARKKDEQIADLNPDADDSTVQYQLLIETSVTDVQTIVTHAEKLLHSALTLLTNPQE